MKLSRSKDLFGGSFVLLALAVTLSGIILINRASSLENRLIMLAGFFCIIILAVYFIYVVKDPKRCFPFVICSSWFVMVEPSPTDVFAVLGLLAFALNMVLYKKSRMGFTPTDILFLVFLGTNVHNLLNTYDLQYSYRFVSITLYLVLFYFLITKVTDSFQLIEKQLNIFLIPCLITSLALLISYFGEVSGLNTGFMQKVWAEGPRAMAFFKDPNVAGPFLILPGIYCFARILNHKNKGTSLYLWMFVLSCVGILVTLSRAAIVCMLFSAIVTLVISADQKKVFKIISMLFISVLIISASLLYLPKSDVFSRIQDTEFGVQSRAERIENGISAFKKSPLIGSGMELTMRNEAPHDSYFLLLSQIGIFGFLAFWIPVSYLSLKLLSASRNRKYAENKIILVTLGATLSSYALFGIVIYFLHWRHFWYIAGLSAAAVQLLRGDQKSAATPASG